MKNDSKREPNSLVDEEHLMSIIAKGTGQTDQPEKSTEFTPTEKKTTIREKKKQKKTFDKSYEEQFLTNHSMTRRGDKSIYIRQEYHERLSRIIQVIGEDKIPLYAYLDNILEHHFEMFEKAITDDFNNKYKPIF